MNKTIEKMSMFWRGFTVTFLVGFASSVIALLIADRTSYRPILVLFITSLVAALFVGLMFKFLFSDKDGSKLPPYSERKAMYLKIKKGDVPADPKERAELLLYVKAQLKLAHRTGKVYVWAGSILLLMAVVLFIIGNFADNKHMYNWSLFYIPFLFFINLFAQRSRTQLFVNMQQKLEVSQSDTAK